MPARAPWRRVAACCALLACALLLPATLHALYSCGAAPPAPAAQPAHTPPPAAAHPLLAAVRGVVALDMQHYNYSCSGARGLRDLQPAAGGRPLRSLLVSTWRSGSSFLGSLLSSAPGTLYVYEPLHTVGVYKQIRDPPQIQRAISLLKNIMKCNNDDYLSKEYLKWSQTIDIHSSDSTYLFVIKLWKKCRENDSCYKPEFLTQLYKLFPIQTIKIVRMRLHHTKELLDDDELDVRLVLLVRDPRAVMHSRVNIDNFCSDDGHEDCEEPRVLCQDMVSDYEAAASFMNMYPGRLVVLRFEELAVNVRATTRRLFEALRLDLAPSVREFLDTHTNVKKSSPDPYSTYKVTKDVPFQWKKTMQFSVVKAIQAECQRAMAVWGYAAAHNRSHFRSDTFNPLAPHYTLMDTTS